MPDVIDLTGDSDEDDRPVPSPARSKPSSSSTIKISSTPLRSPPVRRVSEELAADVTRPVKKRKTTSKEDIGNMKSGTASTRKPKPTGTSLVPKAAFPIFASRQATASSSSLTTTGSPSPSQRAFYHVGSPDSPSLPFSTLTLVYGRPPEGNLAGDNLKISASEIFHYGGGCNERAIVGAMGLEWAYLAKLVGKMEVTTESKSKEGKKKVVLERAPLLLIYHELSLPSGTGEELFAEGSDMLHRAPNKLGLIGMHAKLAILARKAPDGTPFLRIAISTANFNGKGSWSTAENAVFIQDFPSLPDSAPRAAPQANPTHTSFSLGVLTFLESTELPRSDARRHAFLNLFSAYDFTRSNQGRLVHSLSGKFSTQAVDRGREGGLISLAGAVGDLKSFEGGDWNLECMGSSSGRLPRSFLEDLFTAAQGFEPRKRHVTKNAHLLARFDPARIKVVFPCEADLPDSSDRDSAEHVYHWYDGSYGSLADDDLRAEVLHRSRMKCGRLSHTKTILIIHTPTDASAEHEAFLYVGSHNLTVAAWGNYSSPDQVVLRQYELGVVTRLASSTPQELEELIDAHLPYDRPLAPYDASDRPFEREKSEGASGKRKGSLKTWRGDK